MNRDGGWSVGATLPDGVRCWSVALLGAGLLLAAIAHPVVDDDPLLGDLLETGVAALLSLGVIGLGAWARRRDLPPDRTSAIAVWCLAGGLLTLLASVWELVVWSMEGVEVASELVSVLVTDMAFGSLLGGIAGVYATGLRARTEELIEQHDRLDQFARTVSHDLRNPLNIAQGHLELARETGEAEHFATIADAHDRMEQLIGEILGLTGGGVEPALESVRIDELARGTWDGVEADAAELIVRTDDRIRGDPRRLRALFENLFLNAVRHGGADVTVTVGALDGGVGFYVEDDGPGIPVEERERVFEGGYSTDPEGTGMGLAVVRWIAEVHDWDHRVVDGEAGGARFEFRWRPSD